MDFYNEDQESVKNEDEIKNTNKLKKRNLVTPLIATGLSILTAVGVTAAAFSMNQNNVSSSSNDDVKSSDKNTNPSNNVKGNMIYDSSTNSIIVNSDGSINTTSDVTNNSSIKNSNNNTTTSSKSSNTSNNTTSSKNNSSNGQISSTATSSVVVTSSTIDDTKRKLYNNYLDSLSNSINVTHLDFAKQIKPSYLNLGTYELYITTLDNWDYIQDGRNGCIYKLNNKTSERKDPFDFVGNCYLPKGTNIFLNTGGAIVKIDCTNDKAIILNYEDSDSMCTDGTYIYYCNTADNTLRKLNVNAIKGTAGTIIATNVASNSVQLNMNGNKVEINDRGTTKSYTVS